MRIHVHEPHDARGRSPASQLYDFAREAMDRGEIEEALELFRRSGVLVPHFKTFELTGECLLKLERFAESIPFLAAASFLTRGVRAPSLLAEALLAIWEHEKARWAAQLVLTLEPNNKRARNVHEELSKLESAADPGEASDESSPG